MWCFGENDVEILKTITALCSNLDELTKAEFIYTNKNESKANLYVMGNIDTGFYCLLVSLLWGATNPLIKNSTKDITKVQSSCPVKRFFYEIKYLVNNWKYVLFFSINQAGSVLYFVLLQSIELSLIVPLINALTFVITGIVGFLIGENSPSLRTLIGIVLILTGITFCVLDKYHLIKVEK